MNLRITKLENVKQRKKEIFLDQDVSLYENYNSFIPSSQFKLATRLAKGKKKLKGRTALRNFVTRIFPCLISVEDIYR